MPKLTLPSGHAFDAGLAAFAAVSAGFVAFAMPDPLFTGLVQASRLPELVAAARPPLGETARLCVVAAALLFTFAAVWALMAALGRTPPRREAVPEAEARAPRLRRADAHPDAPPRPPLLARDLGEPLELDEVAQEPAPQTTFAEAEHRPVPGFLIPQEPESEFDAPVEEAPPEAEVRPMTEFEVDEPVEEAAPVAEPEPVADAEPVAEAQPEPEAQRRPDSAPLPLAELAAQLPETETEAEESGQSLSQMVNRIEYGLSRKRQALPVVNPPVEKEVSADEAQVGHRLRSAINDLQKIASSGA
jgi:hypothetical protein